MELPYDARIRPSTNCIKAKSSQNKILKRNFEREFWMNPSKKKIHYASRYLPTRYDEQQLNFEIASINNKIAENTKETKQTPTSSYVNSHEIFPEPEEIDDNNNIMEEKDSTYSQVLLNEIIPTYSDYGYKPNSIFQYSTNLPSIDSPFSKSPIGNQSQKLLSSSRIVERRIHRSPFKILRAPDIQDDFYLNLVDWSSQNILAVGLENSVYLWNASTNQVSKLFEYIGKAVTSVSWVQRGTLLAVGLVSGEIEIWDVVTKKLVREYRTHSNRVGTLAWNVNILTSGGRDRFIYHRDIRSPSPYTNILKGHKQEVCGLEWSPDGGMLASGGNDNHLIIWDDRSCNPILKYSDHKAAVKAISWSPHQRGVLASGGGTADRCIRFRNTLTQTNIGCIDTGSQVCNIAWSKNVNELVSTHGYSQNQIVIWNYPSLSSIATLSGHTMRVLYLSVSPDGTTIVTGAGDETLRFWNIFPGVKTLNAGSKKRSVPFFNPVQIR